MKKKLTENKKKQLVCIILMMTMTPISFYLLGWKIFLGVFLFSLGESASRVLTNLTSKNK